MPGLYKAISILNFVCSSEFTKLTEREKEAKAEKFFKIESSKKPKTISKASKQSLLRFFKKLNPYIKQKISEHFNKRVCELREDHPNQNKEGSDLVAILEDEQCNKTKINVELKFGEETNRNIGNDTMDSLFPIDPCRNITFSEIVPRISQQQKEFVDNHPDANDDDIEQNLSVLVIDGFSSLLNDLKESKQITPNSKAIQKLLTTTGSLNSRTTIKDLIKFRIDYGRNLDDCVTLIRNPNVNGNWEIEYANKAPRSIRSVIIATNGVVKAKFLLHWRNKYEYRGRPYAARLGLGSSSWNVWLKY